MQLRQKKIAGCLGLFVRFWLFVDFFWPPLCVQVARFYNAGF